MCGIIGFIGRKNGIKNVLDGLSKLEYRGYDSAGVAYTDKNTKNGTNIRVIKAVGHVEKLIKKVGSCVPETAALTRSNGVKNISENTQDNSQSVCIGHTRWATHGAVTEINAHPHLSASGKTAVVHNGIIENYSEITEQFGFKMKSETDTEVIPNLIEHYYSGDLRAAAEQAIKHLRGSYAFVVLNSETPDTLIAAKNGMPLFIGINTQTEPDSNLSDLKSADSGTADFAFITSDIPTALTKTDSIYILENGELAVIKYIKENPEITQKTTRKTAEKHPKTSEKQAKSTEKHLKSDEKHQKNAEIDIVFYKNRAKIIKKPTQKTKNRELITKSGFTTYMEKEINDIPTVFENLISSYSKNKINPEIIKLLSRANTVHICACGTAYHAGFTLSAGLETHCKIRTKTHIASEFRYNNPLLQSGDIGILISQSGETADTIAAMQLFKQNNIPTAAICNTENSTIAREADFYLSTLAGFEIAVASTKAFCAQVLLGAILVNELYSFQNQKQLFLSRDFSVLPAHTRTVIAQSDRIKALAQENIGTARIFFIGKNTDATASLEAALKVKEITYMQSEGYPAGELKHGTLSLVDKDTLTVAFSTTENELTKSKTENAIAEVRARGSKVLTIETGCQSETSRNPEQKGNTDCLTIPASPLAFTYSVIPAQLFALHLAKLKGLDPDKPRNLAKSVTVE